MNTETALRQRLAQAVCRNLGDSIILSGGLDSSSIAALAPDAKAFTVVLENYGSDFEHAELVVKHLGMRWVYRRITIENALNAIPTVIKILKTFDPAIPNDLATYFGLMLAKEHGCRRVMTGDGGDELFAGYSYMHTMDLREYIPRITSTMCFSSSILGAALGVEIRQPYLDKEFVKFALGIAPSEKVRFMNGKTVGKWILRKAFEPMLPKEIIWREKTAIEYGSGFTELRKIIERSVPDDEFESKQRAYSIRFRGKEHMYYYEIYRKEVGAIPGPKEGEKKCRWCGAGVHLQSSHCRVCGGYPAVRNLG